MRHLATNAITEVRHLVLFVTIMMVVAVAPSPLVAMRMGKPTNIMSSLFQQYDSILIAR
jgi:hypothetical protein